MDENREFPPALRIPAANLRKLLSESNTTPPTSSAPSKS
jgi:hypothetical protein